jgi:glycosyltransferase involved in cell wall biosynthesis
VFVLPAHEEGFAHEVAEAMACGRPAITTDVPGCRETVDERVSGVLVPPRDAMALASAIESFLRRPDLIPWMAQASRHKAERRFDAQAVNRTLLRLLGLAEKG